MPVAVTLNVALLPEHKVCGVVGCVVIATTWLTFNIASFDVTGEHGLVPDTTTLYVPASLVDTLVSVSVALVAPDMFPPLVKLVVPFLH